MYSAPLRPRACGSAQIKKCKGGLLLFRKRGGVATIGNISLGLVRYSSRSIARVTRVAVETVEIAEAMKAAKRQ
jgi:hypothetical protein